MKVLNSDYQETVLSDRRVKYKRTHIVYCPLCKKEEEIKKRTYAYSCLFLQEETWEE